MIQHNVACSQPSLASVVCTGQIWRQNQWNKTTLHGKNTILSAITRHARKHVTIFWLSFYKKAQLSLKKAYMKLKKPETNAESFSLKFRHHWSLSYILTELLQQHSVKCTNYEPPHSECWSHVFYHLVRPRFSPCASYSRPYEHDIFKRTIPWLLSRV